MDSTYYTRQQKDWSRVNLPDTPGPMKREYLDQLAVWFHEEVEAFKAKGATEEILGESAFTSLLVDTVFKSTSMKSVRILHSSKR
jgi:hypothetical protein